MHSTTRRDFLRKSLAASLALGFSRNVKGAEIVRKTGGANNQVQVAVVGLGGIDVVGGVGGRGRKLINMLWEVPGVRITTLCDVDQTILDHGVKLFKDRGEDVAAHKDYRRILDDRKVDAVVLATPNYWHALGTVWACQAGKDVYVEKPFSYDIWEGQQMVAAARKYNRMVQVGTQRRSSALLPQVFELLRGGQLGKIQYAHALVFRARDGIGKVTAPTPIPASVDYDLWCGPTPKGPLMRKQLHYDWHWMWPTGNGEMGNNGLHVIDICRWGLGYHQAPPRAMSIGGRFAFQDDAETPNTQIALLDYEPAPIICEIRNYQKNKTGEGLGKYRNQDRGILIECEGGYFAGDFVSGALFNPQGRKIKDLQDGRKTQEIETAHLANFIEAVRNRKSDSLNAEAQEAHVSATCCHLANISHRLGKQTAPQEIQASLRGRRGLEDAFERCRQYLGNHGIDLNATPAVLGPSLTFDAKQERLVSDFASQGNAYLRREYREGYAVPQIAPA